MELGDFEGVGVAEGDDLGGGGDAVAGERLFVEGAGGVDDGLDGADEFELFAEYGEAEVCPGGGGVAAELGPAPTVEGGDAVEAGDVDDATEEGAGDAAAAIGGDDVEVDVPAFEVGGAGVAAEGGGGDDVAAGVVDGDKELQILGSGIDIGEKHPAGGAFGRGGRSKLKAGGRGGRSAGRR